jgi:DNA-binding NtrC family response regulator
MSNVESELKHRVDAFVNELSDLVRQAALEAVASALKKGETHAPARRPGRPPKAETHEVKVPAKRGRPAKSAAPSTPVASHKRKAGEKRSPQLLAQVTEQVYNHIKSNPGQGVEQIAKALATSTKELTLPIRKLLGEKKITSKGQKRATRYFPK